MSIFRTDRIPSLSRIPEELGREHRFCDRCGRETGHILYRVPKKLAFLYIKDHPKNLHATCMQCAGSTVLTGEDRERVIGPR
jgi:ribosomal protein S27AE